MKVLMIIDSLGMGGAEKTTITLSQSLIRQGHKVDIISVDDINDFNDISPIGQYCINFKKRLFDYYTYGSRLKKLVVSLETDNGQAYDLILAHLEKSSRLAKQAGLNHLFHVIHSTLSETSLANRTGIRRWLKIFNKKRIYDNQKIVCVSQGIADDLVTNLQVSPKQIKVINNGINIRELHELSLDTNEFDDSPYLVHVGRLDAVKRHDRLLKIYQKSDLHLPLYLIGEGEERNHIEHLIKQMALENRVKLLGFRSNPYPLIKGASALLLTSDLEGYPTVLLEALSLGTQAISVDCPSGPHEILSELLPDNLIPLNDDDAFSKRLCAVVKNQELPPTVGDTFSVQSTAENYLNLVD